MQVKSLRRMSAPVCFGLHVGNTNACLAVYKDGRSEVVANPSGTRVSPCDVAFIDNSVLVGPSARQFRYQRDQQQAMIVANCTIASLAHHDNADENVSPEKTLPHVLNYMADIAKTHVNASSASKKLNAVVTLPTSFDAEARSRFESVFAQSPFNLVQIISEPASALMAYDLLDIQGVNCDCLVVRVGGTTTHVSAVSVANGFLKVLGTKESDKFGGQIVTEVVVQFLANEFKRKYKVDPLESKRARLKLSSQAEEVKCVLSLRSTANCHIESLYDGIDFNAQVARARIDNEINKVLPEFVSLVRRLLDQVQWTNRGESLRVLLCGGSAKIPRLQKALADLIPQAQVMSSITTDEVLALGAANQAALVVDLPKRISDGKHQLKVLTASIVARSGTQDLVLVPQGSVLPIRKSLILPNAFVSDNSISIEINFNDEEKSILQPLGHVSLADLSSDSEDELKLSVQVHVHRDGAAHLVLMEKNSNSSANLYINPPEITKNSDDRPAVDNGLEE